ncbi:MAG: dethiobiotin synthase, partial [Planctomycetota bacterium]
MKGLFVTGTDTGIGKTYVSMGLIKGWRARGLRVGVMKPCETGLEKAGEWGPPEDAVRLLEASGASLALDEVCPFQYRAPMAPAEAAELGDGPMPSFDRIKRIYDSIAARHDVTLLEGAGGLLVPLNGT